MAKIVLYMWMSLDGFIAGPEDGPDRGLGIGGERLHRSLFVDDGGPSTIRAVDEVGARVMADVMATGAVLAGRRTFDHGGRWNGDHHDGVPIFVLTRSVPEEPAFGHARYVTDVRDMPPEHVELELVHTLEGPDMLHTRYRVRSAEELRDRV